MEIELSNVLMALALTLFAGLSTGIGGLAVTLSREISKKGLSFALGLSAGVMIYISFMELLSESFNLLNKEIGSHGAWFAILAFFGGMLIVALIDKVIPEQENPHELLGVDLVMKKHTKAELDKAHDRGRMLRTGTLTAIVIAIHNFPEGMATFFSALSDPVLGISIAVAVAIHNIPEGISVAVPIRYATGNRKKAALTALSSGLAEPVGALMGFLILWPFINDSIMAVIFAIVAGIMVFISLDELIPAAEKTGEHHLSIWGLIFGMAIMAFSLQLLEYV